MADRRSQPTRLPLQENIRAIRVIRGRIVNVGNRMERGKDLRTEMRLIQPPLQR